MNEYLLDTSALLAHYNNEPGAARVQSIFNDNEAEVYISAVSVTELARCILNLGAERNEGRSIALEYADIATKVIPIDTAVSIRAYELGSVCKARIPLIDALIAACAGTVNAILIHKDAHFKEIPSDLLSIEELTSEPSSG